MEFKVLTIMLVLFNDAEGVPHRAIVPYEDQYECAKYIPSTYGIMEAAGYTDLSVGCYRTRAPTASPFPRTKGDGVYKPPINGEGEAL